MKNQSFLLILFFSLIFLISCQDIKGINVNSELDYNNDGCINEDDFSIFREYYGLNNLKADNNKDGKVDFSDFVYFNSQINENCKPIIKKDISDSKFSSVKQSVASSSTISDTDCEQEFGFSESYDSCLKKNCNYYCENYAANDFGELDLKSKCSIDDETTGEIECQKLIQEKQSIKIEKLLIPLGGVSKNLPLQTPGKYIMGYKIKHSSVPNIYDIYVITTPDLKIEDASQHIYFSIYPMYGGVFNAVDPFDEIPLTHVGEVDNFLGIPFEEGNSGNLYVGKIDISLFDSSELGQYIVQFTAPDIKEYHGQYWGNALTFDLVNVKSYNIGDSCTTIFKNGNTKDSIDMIFVADGYDNTPQNKYYFAFDVENTLNAMWEEPTFSRYKNKMNVYRIDNLDFKTNCHYAQGGEKVYGRYRSIHCDDNEVRKAANLCDSDGNVIHVLTQLEYEQPGDAAGTASFIESQEDYPLLQLSYNSAGKQSSGIAISKSLYYHARIPMHEMGHVVATLPDYYSLYDQDNITCENHPCMMCNDELDFSDEGLCYDKQAMVEYFNQWCKVKKLEISNPYPNPFNPSNGEVTKVDVTVEYESGQDSCLALMKVFNLKNLWVDFLVSKDPVRNGKHTFIWDGKTIKGDYDPSSIYFYEISIGDKKQTVKGTIIK